MAKCSDKIAVRDFVRSRVGGVYLIPTLPDEGCYWTHINSIPWNRLPESFVLKCNNGSQMNLIVRSKKELDIAKVNKKLQLWLQSNYSEGVREKDYALIQNKIYAEELLPSSNGETPDDYKIMCSDGNLLYIWVDRGRFTKHQRSVYDVNWNLQNVHHGYPNVEPPIPRPDNLGDMLSFVRKLSKGIPLVRIDMYNIGGKLYFGEMTFSSDSGAGLYSPLSWSIGVAKKAHLFLDCPIET